MNIQLLHVFWLKKLSYQVFPLKMIR